jgi:hypothetical protein
MSTETRSLHPRRTTRILGKNRSCVIVGVQATTVRDELDSPGCGRKFLPQRYPQMWTKSANK